MPLGNPKPAWSSNVKVIENRVFMGKCGLESIFGDLAARLPLSPDGNESFTFTSENLPIAPSQIETQNLYICESVVEIERTKSTIYEADF